MHDNERPTDPFRKTDSPLNSIYKLPGTFFFLIIFINTCKQFQLFDNLILDQCRIELEEGIYQGWSQLPLLVLVRLLDTVRKKLGTVLCNLRTCKRKSGVFWGWLVFSLDKIKKSGISVCLLLVCLLIVLGGLA